MIGLSRKQIEAARARLSLPTVALPKPALSTAMLILVFGILAALLFFELEDRRTAVSENTFAPSRSNAIITSPPELRLPLEKTPTGVRTLAPIAADRLPILALPAQPRQNGRQGALIPVPQNTSSAPEPNYGVAEVPAYYPSRAEPPRTRPTIGPPSSGAQRPALVFDRGVRRAGTNANRSDDASRSGSTSSQPLRPTSGPSGPYILPQGTLIPAILETSLDTSEGGPVRALVSADTKGSDGSRVVIPKGSRAIGQLSGEVGADSKRVSIVWSRLLLPDGREVEIEYPAADKAGAPGVKGRVHSNTLGRFAGSLLQTVLNVATFRALSAADSDTVIIGSSVNPPEVFSQRNSNRRRITVPAGTKISIFASRAIDFSK